MAKRKNRWMTNESGKTRTTTTLRNLVINIGGVDFVQQQYGVKALVTYEYDVGHPPTEFDPGSLPVFEVTKILPQSSIITFVDERSSLNIRCWKHCDVLPYLTEGCLQELDAQVEREVRGETGENFDIPEEY